MANDRDEDGLERLFAAARNAQPYNANQEYGFETRLLAMIKEQRNRKKPFFSWAWRLIPAFIVVVMILTVWSYSAEEGYLIGLNAITGTHNDETMLIAYLTGD
jgi:hypothetical protein